MIGVKKDNRMEGLCEGKNEEKNIFIFLNLFLSLNPDF